MPAHAGAPVLLNRDGLNTFVQVIAAQDAVEVVDLVGDEAGDPAVKDGDAPISGDVTARPCLRYFRSPGD